MLIIFIPVQMILMFKTGGFGQGKVVILLAYFSSGTVASSTTGL